MISVVVYGRNDSHGYNLHKRAAISLNCIAEVLTDKDDEIIFVDYNTPDDFITFPEAIADTLTDKCKQVLRIIRVRPAQHYKYFKSQTDLVALEPVSRNVAFRASNPNNRWVLCTNTDMVFAAHDDKKSLSDIVRDLPDGFYELPRYEMPDLLWEGLDRKNPADNIRFMKQWGMRYHINEILERPEFALFDAPGDFQLCLRKDLFAIDGFDERYNLGWHMDSNLCKRFHLLYGKTLSADAHLAGWHCNHTRTQSITHGSGRKVNSWEDVVLHIARPDVPEQRETWGLAGEKLEEIRLNTSRQQKVEGHLNKLVPQANAQIYRFKNDPPEWIDCPPLHLKPYIADIIYPFHRDTVVGYFGCVPEQFKCFVDVWNEIGFKGEIILIGRHQIDELRKISGLSNLQSVSPEEANERCQLFVGDFRVINAEHQHSYTEENRVMLSVMEYLIKLERDKLDNPAHAPRKFIVINGVQYQVSRLLGTYTNMQENPFGTRIRHGYVVPAKKAKV